MRRVSHRFGIEVRNRRLSISHVDRIRLKRLALRTDVAALGHQPYPLTPVLVEIMSAILREAGHRSAHLYIGVRKTFRSLNPHCSQCRTPTGRFIGSLDRRREPKKIDLHHVGVALSRRGRDAVGGFVHLGGGGGRSDNFLDQGDRTGAVGSAHRHDFV